jgi:acetyl esterase/lipase
MQTGLQHGTENLATMRDQPIRVQSPLSDAIKRSDHHVPGPAEAPDVVVRVHRPAGTSEALPCVHSMHGGRYVMGSYLDDDSALTHGAQKLGCVGVSVDTDSLPKPFLGPPEDSYSGLHWGHDHADALGIDPTHTG